MVSYLAAVESVGRGAHLHFLSYSSEESRRGGIQRLPKYECPPPYFESLCWRAAVCGCVHEHLSSVWVELVNPVSPVKWSIDS